MAVTRPLKEGSVTTYQAKVAAGFPDILASEMDADLDTIYAAWNGNVATANLMDGAVTTAKLATGAVTQAKLADNAVGAAQVIDGTLTTAELQVGATTPASVSAFIYELTVNANGNTIIGAVNLTVRATALIVAGILGRAFSTTDQAGGASVQCELQRDGSTVSAWFVVPPAASVYYNVHFPISFLETTAGAHVYQLKLTTGNGTTFDTSYGGAFNRHGVLMGIAYA